MLIVRYVNIINNLLEDNIHVTLCNPTKALQMDLFDPYEEISNPVYLNDGDLHMVAKILAAIYEVQRKYYQNKVDKLLSILPPL